AFPSINAQATAGVAQHEQGLASGLVNTSIQVGGAVVLAVVTAIIGDNPTAVHGELLPGMATTIAVVVGVSTVGLLLTGAVVLGRRRTAQLELAAVSVGAVAMADAVDAVPVPAVAGELVPCEAC